MKYAWLLLLCSCSRIVPVSDTTTTKSRSDTTRTMVSVSVPKSEVHVTINLDSLSRQAKQQDRIIYLKGSNGRSSFDIGITPTGLATVQCHCADSTLKVMQQLVTTLIEKEHKVVEQEEDSVFGKLVKDVKNGLFWILLAAGVVVAIVFIKR